MLSTHFNFSWIDRLLKSPNKQMSGIYNGVEYAANIAIPDYKIMVADHYKDVITGDIDEYCRCVEVSPVYAHYGTVIEFKQAVQIDIHGNEEVLEAGLKALMQNAGPVLIKNAYLSAAFREVKQRNRFPHLNFHIDRHVNMPTRYSVYTRDPFDAEQRHPRESSTLFIASIVGYLQAVKEGMIDPVTTKGIDRSYEIFKQDRLDEYIGRLMIEQRWDEAEGSGEMSMLDNATELHSSYERRYGIRGYHIGVRYLA